MYLRSTPRRLNVTLDDERAAKLARLAERMHVQEATLARSLLATALDEAENLETLIAGHELPDDTPACVAPSLRALEPPGDQCRSDRPVVVMRFLLEPWRWMLRSYAVVDARVAVVTIQDAHGRAPARPIRRLTGG